MKCFNFKRLQQRGDTIIEVLIALAILGLILSISYGSANRSLRGARISQERGEAVKIAETQLEFLKNLVPYNGDASLDIYRSQTFCVVRDSGPSANRIVNFSGDPPENYVDENFSGYPSDCIFQTRYHAAIKYDDTGGKNVFRVTVRWERLGGNNDEVKMFYGLYSNSVAVAGFAFSAPTPPPSPLPSPPPGDCEYETLFAMLIIDRSKSMQNPFESGSESKLETAQFAAAGFIDEVNINASRQGSLVAFDHEGQLYQAFTSSGSTLTSAIYSITHGNGTDILDGLETASDEISRVTPGGSYTEHVLILISDGRGEPEDEAELIALASQLKANGARIYTIGIFEPDDKDGEPTLQQIAGNGGYYISAINRGQLVQAYRDMAGEVSC